jgi:hypothetical protein
VPGTEPKDDCELCSGSDIGVRGATRAPSVNVIRQQGASAVRAIQDSEKGDIKRTRLFDDVSSDLLSD